MVFGLAGSLPYIATSGATVYLARQAGEAASGVVAKIDPGVAMSLLDQAMSVQVTYGAVMLGFLGALHWGMEFAGYGGHKGSKRLLLGIAPTLVGWSTLGLDPGMALVTQWAGFTGLWYADMKATAAGWSKFVLHLAYLHGIEATFSTCLVFSISLLSLYSRRNLHYWHPRRNFILWPYPVPLCHSARVTQAAR
jgi:hypothetical protein